MSEITANLFQFSKRANTINVNQEEMPDYNSKINLITDRYGEHFENFKDLFKFLIDFAIQEPDFSENPGAITLKEGEIVIQASEIDDLKTEHATIVAGLNDRITGFEADETARFAKELSRSQAMENTLLVPVTPEQKELLQIIAVNRCEAGYEVDSLGTPDTADSIIRRIAFQGYNLRNEYKRFYTGL